MAKKLFLIIVLALALGAYLILRPLLFEKAAEPKITDRLPDEEFIGRVNLLAFARESQKITEKNQVATKDFLSYDFILSQSKNYGINFNDSTFVFGNSRGEFGLITQVKDSSKILSGVNRLKIIYPIKDTLIDNKKLFVLKKEKLYFYYDKNYSFIYKGNNITQKFLRIHHAKSGGVSPKWKEFLSEKLFKEDPFVISTKSPKLNEFGLNKALFSIHSDSSHFIIKTGVTKNNPLNIRIKNTGYSFEKNQETTGFLDLHIDLTKFKEKPDDQFLKAINKFAKRIAFPTQEFLDAWEGDITYLQGGTTSVSESYIETVLDEEFNPIEVRKSKSVPVPKYSIMLSLNDKKERFFELLKQKGILTVEGKKFRFLTSPPLSRLEHKNYTVFNSGDMFPKIIDSTVNSGFQMYNGKKYDYLIKEIQESFILGEFKIEFSDFENYIKSL
ncbi:MAG: hypothetical protein RLZ10_1521 [Bacteroidota bacterium]|jgi:hypothetical protein